MTQAGVLPRKILDFWFGTTETLQYDGGLWWKGMMKDTVGRSEEERKMNTDKFIRDLSIDLLENGQEEVRSWTSPYGVVASIILYDQFPRHVFRGTAKAFEYDRIASNLANKLLTEKPHLFSSATFTQHLDLEDAEEPLPWVYQIFIYFALIHSEDLRTCEKGACGLANLQEYLKEFIGTSTATTVAAKQAVHRLVSLLRGAKEHLYVLATFGRYPHRNQLLGRISTTAEKEFMKQDGFYWMKTQIPRMPNSATPEAEEKPMTKVHTDPRNHKGFRVLVLHSNRQSSEIFQKKTKNVLSKAVGPNSTLVYTSAPHKYKAQGEARSSTKHLLASDNPATRCWWNASDDPKTMIYTGIEETIKYIDSLGLSHGPFDGIIGFSQGGTAVGLIAALISDQSPLTMNIAKALQFCVIISGFYVRDIRPEYFKLNGPNRDRNNPIRIPSFHVWGLNDILVDPSRSEALKDSFADLVNGIPKAVVPHNLDHFAKAINVWPITEINKWINTHFTPRKYEQDSLFSKLVAIRDNKELLGIDLDDKVAMAMKPLIIKVDNVINDVSIEMVDKKLFSPRKRDIVHIGDSLCQIVKMYGPSQTDIWDKSIRTILSVFPNAIAVFYHADKSVNVFRKSIVSVVSESILNSLRNKKCDFISENLPNRNNRQYVKSGLINDIVTSIVSGLDPRLRKNKPTSLDELDIMGTYQNLQNELDLYSDHTDYSGKENRAEKVKQGFRNQNNLELLLKSPLSDAIVNPRPEPVDIAKSEEMAHLHVYLRSGNSPDDKVFPKGTLCNDGRLDLCKQVIGPSGVFDLEKSLEMDGSSSDPKVKHLLLGNNVAGSNLGESVAKLIRNKATRITTWYIAGNNLDSNSILPVMQALVHDDYVNQLWLKRNPLKPAGARSMERMLSINSHIRVLDLTNTGLLDDGTEVVALAIASNPKSAIEILYLSSNGITYKGIEHVCNMLKSNKIKKIGLGCNRLGNQGAERIATVLNHIQSLEISSCGIGSQGGIAIANALHNNTTLRVLDIGFLRSTNALSEIPNAIGNLGAIALATALKVNKTLLSLNILHNGIYQNGVSSLADVLTGDDGNTTLLHLNIEQLGIPHNELSREAIRRALNNNKLSLNMKELEEAMNMITPPYLEDIKSVYRNEQ